MQHIVKFEWSILETTTKFVLFQLIRDEQTIRAQDHRTKQTTWPFNPLKGKRDPMVEYETLTELFPQMMPELSVDEAANLVTEELMDIAPDKRPDNIVYKDGFLGVRG